MNAQTVPAARSRHALAHAAGAASSRTRNTPGLLVSAAFVALLSWAQGNTALAATAPSLGSTSTYGVVSSTFTNSNTAPQTIINGNVCYTTGPTTPPLIINGTGGGLSRCGRGRSARCLGDSEWSSPCTPLPVGTPLDTVVIGANPPGTFPPGCYFRAGALDITANTTVTLNGAGVYIFRSTGGALTTGADSHVVLAGGACASDVFWAPVGATTLGANSAPSLTTPTFEGNILDAAGITIGHFANLTGRALAFGGTVTTDADTITVPGCAAFVAGGIPTLSEWAMVMLAALLAIAGFAAIRRLAR